MSRQPDLWECPRCGRGFANRNQSHACGTWSLDTHFRGKSPEVRALYTRFLALVERSGPVRVLPEKTRIAFQVRMSFAQLTTRRHWVLGHLVLARRAEDPRFLKIDTISPRNHVHHFRLDAAEDVDRLEPFVREAYAVGCQQHLGRDARQRS